LQSSLPDAAVIAGDAFRARDQAGLPGRVPRRGAQFGVQISIIEPAGIALAWRVGHVATTEAVRR